MIQAKKMFFNKIKRNLPSFNKPKKSTTCLFKIYYKNKKVNSEITSTYSIICEEKI